MNFKENINAPKVGAITPKGVTDKPLTGGVLYFVMKPKICGIYKITSPTKKIYIGQSVNIRKRFNSYKALSCKTQHYLYHSFVKYGVDKHNFEVIHQCNPDQLNELEKYYVDLFQCFNSKYGLNLREGGGRESKMRPITEEKRRNLSKSHMGQRAHNKGKPMSEEQYEKCKATMFKPGCIGIRKGVKLTEEHREKIRIAHMGKKLSLDHRMNISKKLKGMPSKLKGTKRPAYLVGKSKESSKKRMRNKLGQYV